MSIIGRNPPPDLIAKRIHYCDRCGYGSSAGPCRSHHPESQHAAERNQMTVEPLRRGEDPHPGPFSAEGAEQLRAMPGEMRERLAAGRDMTPGAPHPDPRLAARGWQASDHGTYIRRQAGQQLEAG